MIFKIKLIFCTILAVFVLKPLQAKTCNDKYFYEQVGSPGRLQAFCKCDPDKNGGYYKLPKGIVCDSGCDLEKPKTLREMCHKLGVMALEQVQCDKGCMTVSGSADFDIKEDYATNTCTAIYKKKCIPIPGASADQYNGASQR